MPVQPVAPALRGVRLSAQHWWDLVFLHWPIEPAAVVGLFPDGVRPDVHDGLSYVGLVPFRMHGAGPGGRLPVRYFGDFCETNVRLYSVDEQDRHGIVFLTLDAQRLATVLLARLSLGLPYAWSAMSLTGSVESAGPTTGSAADPAGTADRLPGSTWVYRSRRRWPAVTEGRPGATSTVALRVGEPAVASPLEVWLTARWGLHTRVAGRTIWVPNEHPPWPLYQASLLELGGELVASCGIAVQPDQMLRPLFSPGVRTTFGLPRTVSR